MARHCDSGRVTQSREPVTPPRRDPAVAPDVIAASRATPRCTLGAAGLAASPRAGTAVGAGAAAAQLDLTVGLAGAPGARTVCGAAPHRRRLPGAPGNTALPPGRAGGGAARGHLRPWRAGRSPGSARRPRPCGAPRGAALNRALGRARRWPRQTLVRLCAVERCRCTGAGCSPGEAPEGFDRAPLV